MEIERGRRRPGAVQIEREREERSEAGKKAQWRFFCAGVLFKISSTCWRVFQIFFL
jgi:hypothetical protein